MAEQTQRTDEWEDDSPSLYRRRDKPVGVRRQRGKSAVRVFRLVFMNVVGPLAILFGVYLLAASAASSRLFLVAPLQRITLRGNHIVSREQLFESLGFSGQESDSQLNLFRLNLAAERRRLEEIPWVKSAVITRVFPYQLGVRVVERTPVAFANVAGQIELVDRDGAFLRMPPRASYDFPVLDGLDSIADIAERKERLGLYLRFMAEVRPEIAQCEWKVSQAGLSQPDDLRVLLVEGRETVLVHFGDKDFGQRFKTFLALVPRVLQTYSGINSMDLRYHNEAVVEPESEMPPAGVATHRVRGSRR